MQLKKIFLKRNEIPSKKYLLVGGITYVLGTLGFWIFVDILGFAAWITSIFWGAFITWLKWLLYLWLKVIPKKGESNAA